MCLAISGVQLNLVWEFSEEESDGEQVQLCNWIVKLKFCKKSYVHVRITMVV